MKQLKTLFILPLNVVFKSVIKNFSTTYANA